MPRRLLTFSWNTKQLSRAAACAADRSLKRPLNIISVRSSSSALRPRGENRTSEGREMGAHTPSEWDIA